MSDNQISLTSAEISSLWMSYIDVSISKCVLGYMANHIKDQEIKQTVEMGRDIASTHLEELKTIFQAENYAVPNGFTDEDVNMDAPSLFTDVFCLTYTKHMAKISMIASSGFVGMSYRKDIRDYFKKALNEATNLFDHAMDLALTKGIAPRHPSMKGPTEVDYINTKQYMSGLNPFSEKRPLNAIEISHLYSNAEANAVGANLCIAFAQTSPTKEVQEFMLRSKEVAQKHISVFADFLLNDDIAAGLSSDHAVSNSTTKTFSDKLMMYHMTMIIAAGIGNYATAGAASQRSDVMTSYERLSMESAKVAKSGADLMIGNNWMEQPPGTVSREKLARNKEIS